MNAVGLGVHAMYSQIPFFLWSMSACVCVCVCVCSVSEIRVCCRENPLFKKELLKVVPFWWYIIIHKNSIFSLVGPAIYNWTCKFQYQSVLHDQLWPKWQDLVIYVLFFSQGLGKMKNFILVFGWGKWRYCYITRNSTALHSKL